MTTFPNTGSTINRGTGDSTEGRTSSGLSTQIIIKINDEAVGALQSLSVNQTRGLTRITEIGVDGVIEIVPTKATEFTLEVDRIVFDQLRLPEAFSRTFRFIAAQRIPFDIDIFDTSKAKADATTVTDAASSGVIVMTYTNCWFTSYNTPYQTGNYIITEKASIWAETGFVSSSNTPDSLRTIDPQTDSGSGNIESSVNIGGRRGSLDAFGIVNAVFPV